jgi:hypothetical protein
MIRIPKHIAEVSDLKIAKQFAIGHELIVLLDHREASRVHLFENLFRVRSDGSIAWRARAPGSTTDNFVDAEFDGVLLCANSWESYWVELDPSTGERLSCEFTK